MGGFRYLPTAALLFFVFQGFAGNANAAEPFGILECTVASGVGFVVTSSKALTCTFRPESGKSEYYVGTMRRFGLDVGVTSPGVLAWRVFSVGASPRFALAGHYAGAVTELSIGAGLGANALVGGSGGAITLQPVSLNAAFGVSLAAGVGEVILEPAAPSPMH